MEHNLPISEALCLMRFKCDKADLFDAVRQIRTILERSSPIKRECGVICYYYTASALSGSINAFLEENLNTRKDPIPNSSIAQSDRPTFVAAPRRRFIFELVVEQEEYISDLQYLLLILHYLENKRENYHVLISKGLANGKRYNPLNEENYFRISHQLYFYAVKNAEKTCNKVNRNILIFAKESSAGRVSAQLRVNWRPAFPKDIHYGRIIPHIPITHESFRALLCNPLTATDDHWTKLFKELCDTYYERITNGKGDKKALTNLANLLASDNYLERLIFLTSYYFIWGESKNQNVSLTDMAALHEECMDITQGVYQLAENITEHVLGTDGTQGCGILTMRIRDIKDAEKLYLKDAATFPNVRYFMELYITDLQYGKLTGIVEKFLENVKSRMDGLEPQEANCLENAKMYYSQHPRDDVEKTCPVELQEKVLRYYDSLPDEAESRHLSLDSFFAPNQCRPLHDFLTSLDNVAFHYGLQILNNVIAVRDGYLFVTSGPNLEDCFQAGSEKYNKMDDFSYCFGTAYVIYLPFKLRKNVEYIDVPAVILKDTNDPVYSTVPYTACALPQVRWGQMPKESRVIALKNSILDTFRLAPDEDVNKIGVIKCAALIGRLGGDRSHTVEQLARAVFLYLAGGDRSIDHIALIDIPHPYSVIKIFRQFALFFDRMGESTLIKHEKSVFIVDDSGETDILFYGNNIQSIQRSLFLGQLYGGSNEITMEIIEHLTK